LILLLLEHYLMETQLHRLLLLLELDLMVLIMFHNEVLLHHHLHLYFVHLHLHQLQLIQKLYLDRILVMCKFLML
jgi:hypothetical protein